MIPLCFLHLAERASRESTRTVRERACRDAVLRLVREARFGHRIPACLHCRDTSVIRWGWFSGRRRYRCKACRRTFSDLTDSALQYLKKLHPWPAQLELMGRAHSIRDAAAVCGVHRTTAVRWRRRVLGALVAGRPRLRGRLGVVVPHRQAGTSVRDRVREPATAFSLILVNPRRRPRILGQALIGSEEAERALGHPSPVQELLAVSPSDAHFLTMDLHRRLGGTLEVPHLEIIRVPMVRDPERRGALACWFRRMEAAGHVLAAGYRRWIRWTRGVSPRSASGYRRWYEALWEVREGRTGPPFGTGASVFHPWQLTPVTWTQGRGAAKLFMAVACPQ